MIRSPRRAAPRLARPGHFVSLALLLLLLFSTARAAPAPTLPPPFSNGAAGGLLGPSPATEGTGGHFRGVLSIAGAGAGAPLQLDYRLSAAASLLGWAELGATFTGRWLSVGQHQAGPVEMWLHAGPRLGKVTLQGVLELASGRGGFDYGGAVYTSTTTLGAVLGSERGRLSGWLSACYQSAGEDLAQAHYRGAQLGAAGWVTAVRDAGRYNLQIGAEGLARLGWVTDAGALDVAAVFAVTVRLVDRHGAAFAAGGGKGWGPGMPQNYGAVRVGYSFGPGYVREVDPSVPALLPLMEDWVGQRLRELGRPRAPELPALPPLGLHAAGPPVFPGPMLTREQPPLLAPPGTCDRFSGFRSGAVTDLARMSCGAPGTAAAPPSPAAGPPAPALPYGPPAPPSAIAGGGSTARPGMPRRGLRYGRGTGWEDPETRTAAAVTAAGRPPPFVPGAPGPRPPVTEIPSIGPAGPRPGEQAQRPPAPARLEDLTPQMRILLGLPALQPMAPPAPRPEPQPQPRPAEQQEAVHTQRPRSGGIGPVLQGRRGVADYNEARERAGREAVGEEVTFETRYGRRRADVIEIDPATGEPVAVEVKTGQSRYTAAQRKKDAEIAAGRARGVGPRAEKAGVAGPVKIQTRLVRLPAIRER